MVRLGVNIDHVATLRQARRASEPDPVHAAVLAELGGADGITVHLRGDRRHIQDRDVEILRQVVKTRLNVEMAATQEMVRIALTVKPDQVTLVARAARGDLDRGRPGRGPEQRPAQAHGQDPEGRGNRGQPVRRSRPRAGQGVAQARRPRDRDQHRGLCGRPRRAGPGGGAAEGRGRGPAGRQARPLRQRRARAHLRQRGADRRAPEIHELNIGHNIVARAALVGMERAVQEMVAAMRGRAAV